MSDVIETTEVADTNDDAMSVGRLQILLSFFSPHWGAIAVGLVLGLAVTATSLWTPLIVEDVMNALALDESLSQPIMVLAGLTVVGIVATLAQMLLLGKVAENVVYDARASLVRRFFRGRVGDVTAHPAGELVTRATSDTLLLREATSSSIVSVINGLVGMVGTIVLMGAIDPLLLGLTVAALVVFGGLMMALMPRVGTEQARAQNAVGQMGGELEGGLRALRTVKVAGAEGRQSDVVLGAAEAARRHGLRALKAESIAWTSALGGIQIATVGVIALGAWRVSQGELTVAALVAFMMYVFNFPGPMMEVAQGFSSLQTGMAAAERISQARRIKFEGEGAHEAGTAAEDAMPTTPIGAPILDFRGVTASYVEGAKPAVKDLTLQIPRIGHVAVVGPSGAGKTSILALALRFLEPSHGQILLDGTDFQELTFQQVRQRFAYVEQETPVVPGTIRDNLLFANDQVSDTELAEVLDTVLLTEDLARLPDGLDTSLVSSSVSGGQRQRIAMARALLRKSDVLLLDEATSQVDGRTEAAILEAIKRAARSGAVITIAHRLSTVIDADTIVVMEAGHVRAAGTHSELLTTDELYHELVTALRINDGA